MIPTAVDWERRMNHRQAIQATNEWRFGIVICYVAVLLVVPNSNSSTIHIAAKVSFRLNNQSVGSTYY
jgi:hypothetical protein